LPIAPRRPASAALAGSFLSIVRIAALIDWQNAYKSAREAFGWRDWPNEYGNFSPYAFGRLVAAGNGRGDEGELTRVFVYRGLPSNRHDPEGYAANRRQSADWMAEQEEIVIPKLRPLRYSEGEPPREKGIDVQLAIDAIELILKDRCDTVVILSHDTDLLPAVEALIRLGGADSVETASWISERFQSRLRPRPAVFHHSLDVAAFGRIERRVNYAHHA
jgi:uncharacterized LabA/DUF88 family protein